ncbi:MAG: nicotinate phosphoribosyltransferase [Gammaproteobacteria bacterium]|nr:nicotinate phosphoribosyltransferase [Gammaproteobacteria bacterium]
MSQLFFKQGLHERPAQFEHYFRTYPNYGDHSAGYCVNCGMGEFKAWLRGLRVGPAELGILRQHKNSQGEPVFAEDYLSWLASIDFRVLNIRAVAEGRLVHPNTPLTVVEGPLAIAQLIETPLLAMLNYQTLIATRAARIKAAGRGRLMLDFGLRRGQGWGANAGSRAALIGGADFSSNVGVSAAMGLAARGTHAHSMVQVFMALGMSEFDAFMAYADLYPDQCLLLVDTVDTLNSGVPNAIRVFEHLKAQGHEPVGVRLDSGDLAHLAIQVRRQLDEAGFCAASIALSNNLDEMAIWQIITQIQNESYRYDVDATHLLDTLVWGVGTKLMTSDGAPALGGVYKLVSIQSEQGWQPAIKLSESSMKTPNPGRKQLWRIYDQRGLAAADFISLEEESFESSSGLTLHHPIDTMRQRELEPGQIDRIEPMLTQVDLDDDELLQNIRDRRNSDMERLDLGVRRMINPHIYHVSLSEKLWNLKQTLIKRYRQ